MKTYTYNPQAYCEGTMSEYITEAQFEKICEALTEDTMDFDVARKRFIKAGLLPQPADPIKEARESFRGCSEQKIKQFETALNWIADKLEIIEIKDGEMTNPAILLDIIKSIKGE
jgi:hypothetical protein